MPPGSGTDHTKKPGRVPLGGTDRADSGLPAADLQQVRRKQTNGAPEVHARYLTAASVHRGSHIRAPRRSCRDSNPYGA